VFAVLWGARRTDPVTVARVCPSACVERMIDRGASNPQRDMRRTSAALASDGRPRTIAEARTAAVARSRKAATLPAVETGSGTIRVVLCDDHVMVREGLKKVIDGVDGIVVVASASDGEEGVEVTMRLRPDVVLMDLAMPGVDGVEATRRIAVQAPDSSVVVLTSFAEQARVLEAIDAGACGYVLKDASVEEVVRAIHVAAAGDSPLDPRIARAVVSRTSGGDPFAVLSDREREVLELVADGIPSRVIAHRLGITEPTVRAHLTRIYRHIGVDDRTQAALWAVEHGMGRG
jgi:DNA-binding NarL/FixJ family response regulator